MTTTPVFLVEALPTGPSTELTGPEGHHAATVRRVRTGEALDLGDGAGGLAHCTVVAVGRDMVSLAVTGIERLAAPSPRLLVAQALAKGDRGELAVELLTEAGVDVVVPWAAERCVARWSGDRGAKSLRRWQSAAREAAKQSRRAWLPEVREPVSTTALASLVTSCAATYVLHESAEVALVGTAVPVDGDLLVVVGPEGGISDRELAALSDAGAAVVRLGDSVLRTSSAGFAATAVLSAATGRWS